MTRTTTETYPDASDESLLRVSISACNGFEVLVEDGAGSHLIYAMGLLACHSLETCLKAYLMQNGKTVSDVKGFMHRLPALWSAAKEEGLDIDVTVPDWVNNLGFYHDQPYHLKYPPHQHGMPIHDPKLILSALKDIIGKVRSSSGYIL